MTNEDARARAKMIAGEMHDASIRLWNELHAAAGSDYAFPERARVEMVQRALSGIAWPRDEVDESTPDVDVESRRRSVGARADALANGIEGALHGDETASAWAAEIRTIGRLAEQGATDVVATDGMRRGTPGGVVRQQRGR